MGDVMVDSGILDQIQSLVIDASQVCKIFDPVYTFNFPDNVRSSREVYRILEEFAKLNEGNKVEVVYAVCGWSKSEPRTYNVQLVPKVKLQEVKQGFDEHASQHVYSVQPCLPKDPAQLFGAEYVQAQELFLQPRDVDNCLRDNRFSSVSYSEVTRGIGGSKAVIDQHKSESSASAIPLSSKIVAGSTTLNVVPQGPQAIPPHSAGQKDAAFKNAVGETVVKEESAGKFPTTSAVPGKVVPENIAVGKKKTVATGGASSLANLWGKAPAKAKAATPAAIPALISGDAEAAIRATEDDGSEPSSDEETSGFSRIRRCLSKNGKGRKRQVVLDEDLSEDEEGMSSQAAINLASPEPFKKKTQVKIEAENDLGTKVDISGPTKMEVDEETIIIGNPQADLGITVPEEASKPVESLVGVKREAENGPGPGASVKPPTGTKRKKVLKTRINERGKEVTEVVWETDGVEEVPEGKSALVPDKALAPPLGAKMPAERPAAPVKAPQKGVTTKPPGKAGSKAAASKGQGSGQSSLRSYFTKKT